MPTKKNEARQPIGKGKAGSMKRMLYKAGMGKKALATWRSQTSAAGRKQNKETAKQIGAGRVISAIRASRTSVGRNPTTGAAPRRIPKGTRMTVAAPVPMKSAPAPRAGGAKVAKVAAKVTARSGKTGSDALKAARSIVKGRKAPKASASQKRTSRLGGR
jgi:hypothetical protein